PRCNWCSAPLPSDHETVCPSCGATLLGDGDTTSVPGLTAIDAEAILRNARAAKAKPRSRLLGWISGEYDDEASATSAAPGSLAPPPADVRREMLRLELEAQVANAQAEVESMAADAAVEEGRSLAPAAAVDADLAAHADDAVDADAGIDADVVPAADHAVKDADEPEAPPA
ncbi:MAG: hypothetical protein ABIZ72_02025, partial [Candidatus Limnocylindrales bacterium]